MIKRLGRFKYLIAFFLVVPSISSAALQVSGSGGISFGSGEAHSGYDSLSPLLGGELTYGLADVFQIGGFFDYNFLPNSANVDASTWFTGPLARIGFGYISDIFFDLKVGLTKTNVGTFSSNTAVGVGAGIGYNVSFLPLISLKPRIGYRLLPFNVSSGSFSRHMIDFGAVISFSI